MVSVNFTNEDATFVTCLELVFILNFTEKKVKFESGISFTIVLLMQTTSVLIGVWGYC